MFLGIGVMYDRMHTRDISAYGGVVNTMPVFAVFMLIFAMANAGLPGTSGFVGEFLVILAAFKSNFWLALGAATMRTRRAGRGGAITARLRVSRHGQGWDRVRVGIGVYIADGACVCV